MASNGFNLWGDLNMGELGGNMNTVGGIVPTLPGLGQAGNSSPGFWSMDSFMGNNDSPGWGQMALGAASGLMNGFMSMKQYGLAKDTLSAQREAFEKNYAAQRQTTNTQLEDRQRARVASNPTAYESVGAYMDRNRIV